MAIDAHTRKDGGEAGREAQSSVPPRGDLYARGIHVRLQGRDILRGIDFGVGPGEVVSLLGANGAGKTTLLKVLLGLAAPERGEVVVGEAPLASLPRREVARWLAYVPQVHVAPFPYSVREIVAMGRLPRSGLWSRPSGSDHEIVQRVLERLKLGHLADRIYSEISGGERQLTLIARALAQEAPILILDEPMANLDVGYQAVLGRHLRELAEDGRTVLMSCHDPQLAYHTSSRIALLVAGQLVADGAPDETMTTDVMRSVYGVAVDRVTLPDGRTAFFPESPRGG